MQQWNMKTMDSFDFIGLNWFWPLVGIFGFLTYLTHKLDDWIARKELELIDKEIERENINKNDD